MSTEAFDAWQEQGEMYQRSAERSAWGLDDPQLASEEENWTDEVQLLRKVSPTQVELTCSVCGSWYAIAQDGIFRHYLSEHPESVQASAIRQWLSAEE